VNAVVAVNALRSDSHTKHADENRAQNIRYAAFLY